MSVEVPVDALGFEEAALTGEFAFATRAPVAALPELTRASELGVEMVEDRKYELEQGVLKLLPEGATSGAGLSDVTALIGADEAWRSNRGEGAIIAVVDTGVDGRRPEFAGRQFGGWAPQGEDPWTDYRGHGTMAACIAAGNSAEFTGVAPEAQVFSARTHFYDSELAEIYDQLTDLAKRGKRVIATNSWGLPAAIPPAEDGHSDFLPALDEAVRAGVVVIFSAGNYHELAGGTPSTCGPTSIWLHKCRRDVLTVATCQMDGRIWSYSSRGPGQFSARPECNVKPDVTAPTPANGLILYGATARVMANGWGTSGAAPQAAGLAALLLTKVPNLSPQSVYDVTRRSCLDLRHCAESQGSGLIQCATALSMVH